MSQATCDPAELRSEVRYRLSAPAVFSWKGPRNKQFSGEGMTRDISVQGAFIWAAASPPIGWPIQVELQLPPLTGVNAVMRVAGKARVVRVHNAPRVQGTNGFAVMTDESNQWGLAGLPDASGSAGAKKERAALKVSAKQG